MAGFALSGAAAGAAGALEDLLKQEFLKQIQRQKLAEDVRQADMRQGVAMRGLDQGDRRISEDTRQFNVSSGQRDRSLAMDEQVQPVRLKQMQAQTAEIERKPQAEQQERDFITGRDKTQHAFQMREIGARQVPAGDNSGQFTSVQQVVGPDGKPALAIVDRRTSTATPVQMPQGFEPNRPARPVTGSERQTLNFFNRMLQAEKDARAVEDKLSGTDLAAMEFAPGWLENFAKSKEGQQYTQAQRTYTEARLRKESGAAVPPGEYESDRKTGFRSAGDKDEVLKQKRNARLTTLRGIGNASGRALQEFYGEDAKLDDLLKEFAAAAQAQGGGPSALDILNARRKGGG